MNRVLAITFLLAFAGGYSDAVSFLLTGSFTGHLTGNTVLCTIHSAQANWGGAAANALAIAAFAAGTTASGWMAPRTGEQGRARRLRLPLLIEGALGLAALGCRLPGSAVGDELCVACLCLMMGQQNGALQRCGSLSVHTTFITGMSTTFLTEVAQRASGEAAPADQRKHQPGTLAALLVIFAVGALAGAWADRVWKMWSLAGLLAPLAVSLGLTVDGGD